MTSSKVAAGLQYDLFQTQNNIQLLRDDLNLVKTEMASLGESSQTCNELLRELLAKRNNSNGSAIGHFGSFEFGEHVQNPSFKQRGHVADHQMDMPWKTSQFTTKKQVYWRWSTYRLPIGLLSIEASQAESNQTLESNICCQEKQTKVIFVFSPPKWVIDSMVQISYTLTMNGNNIPSWQKSQCGSTSIFPQALRESLKNKDLLAAGTILANISSIDGVRHLSKYMNAVSGQEWDFCAELLLTMTFFQLPPASRSSVSLNPKTITQESQSFRLSFDTAMDEVATKSVSPKSNQHDCANTLLVL